VLRALLPPRAMERVVACIARAGAATTRLVAKPSASPRVVSVFAVHKRSVFGCHGSACCCCAGARSHRGPPSSAAAGLAAAAAGVAAAASAGRPARAAEADLLPPPPPESPHGAQFRSAPLPVGKEPAEDQDFTVFCRHAGGGPPASTSSLAELLAVAAPSSAGAGGAPSVILLGEVHDDMVAHRLQLRVLQHCIAACRAHGRRLVLSLEMFEGDVQPVLDEYVLRRAIREEDLLQDSRPWANYRRDYRPLVELCREHGVRVIAANAPRRYVSLVARCGSGSLQELLEGHEAGTPPPRCLPPLPMPPASASYRQKFIETIASQMAPPQAGAAEGGTCPFIGFRASDVRETKPEMMEAQLLWDHAMARSIAGALQSEPGESQGPEPLVIHVCGAFHCAHGLGIPEVLPLYMGRPPHPPATEASAVPTDTWLPMDDAMAGGPPDPESAAAAAGESQQVGPKQCPPGVLSVVCWPAAVAATLELVGSGHVPEALGTMGDWVIITEEAWGDAPEQGS